MQNNWISWKTTSIVIQVFKCGLGPRGKALKSGYYPTGKKLIYTEELVTLPGQHYVTRPIVCHSDLYFIRSHSSITLFFFLFHLECAGCLYVVQQEACTCTTRKNVGEK